MSGVFSGKLIVHLPPTSARRRCKGCSVAATSAGLVPSCANSSKQSVSRELSEEMAPSLTSGIDPLQSMSASRRRAVSLDQEGRSDHHCLHACPTDMLAHARRDERYQARTRGAARVQPTRGLSSAGSAGGSGCQNALFSSSIQHRHQAGHQVRQTLLAAAAAGCGAVRW